jgi:hypothetical protein
MSQSQTRRIAELQVSLELLIQALGLPQRTTFHTAKFDHYTDSLLLCVRGPWCPETPRGAILRVEPEFWRAAAESERQALERTMEALQTGDSDEQRSNKSDKATAVTAGER